MQKRRKKLQKKRTRPFKAVIVNIEGGIQKYKMGKIIYSFVERLDIENLDTKIFNSMHISQVDHNSSEFLFQYLFSNE